jgi:hypothetical protein
LVLSVLLRQGDLGFSALACLGQLGPCLFSLLLQLVLCFLPGLCRLGLSALAYLAQLGLGLFSGLVQLVLPLLPSLFHL